MSAELIGSIALAMAMLAGFIGGRSWGEAYPRPWPTAWVRLKCRVLGHRWCQPSGPFTASTCRRCDRLRGPS